MSLIEGDALDRLREVDESSRGQEEARRRRETLALQRRFLTPCTLRPEDILPAEERSGEWQTKPQP